MSNNPYLNWPVCFMLALIGFGLVAVVPQLDAVSARVDGKASDSAAEVWTESKRKRVHRIYKQLRERGKLEGVFREDAGRELSVMQKAALLWTVGISPEGLSNDDWGFVDALFLPSVEGIAVTDARARHLMRLVGKLRVDSNVEDVISLINGRSDGLSEQVHISLMHHAERIKSPKHRLLALAAFINSDEIYQKTHTEAMLVLSDAFAREISTDYDEVSTILLRAYHRGVPISAETVARSYEHASSERQRKFRGYVAQLRDIEEIPKDPNIREEIRKIDRLYDVLKGDRTPAD